MTDMDWADKIADGLCAAGEYVGQTKAVAAALRKAKADGMREAAAIAYGLLPNKPTFNDREAALLAIHAAADKLSPPES